jgi:hypothetical protein
MKMIKFRLYGVSSCRRYVKMRTIVTNEAKRLGIELNLEEIDELESLSQFNPLSLPRLYIQDNLVALQNPPRPREVVLALLEMDQRNDKQAHP